MITNIEALTSPVVIAVEGRGPAGVSPAIEIGTVTTLAPGEEATAEMTGSPTNRVLNLGLPAGDPGLAELFRGLWEADEGTFPATGAEAGHSWLVSVAGTVGGMAFAVGDRLIALIDSPSAGTYLNHWYKLSPDGGMVLGPSGAVTDGHIVLFDGTSGNKIKTAGKAPFSGVYNDLSSKPTLGVLAAGGDASDVPFTNSGTGLVAANVQTAIAEVVALGTVRNVVFVSKTSTFTASSGSFVDVTGLSVTITPGRNTSRVLLFAMVNIGGDDTVDARLVKGSTPLHQGDAAGGRERAGATVLPDPDGQACAFLIGIDSPASTSAQTYKVQIKGNSETNSPYVNRSLSDTDSSRFSRTASTIVAIEVAP